MAALNLLKDNRLFERGRVSLDFIAAQKKPLAFLVGQEDNSIRPHRNSAAHSSKTSSFGGIQAQPFGLRFFFPLNLRFPHPLDKLLKLDRNGAPRNWRDISDTQH